MCNSALIKEVSVHAQPATKDIIGASVVPKGPSTPREQAKMKRESTNLYFGVKQLPISHEP
jgi:hypothetical protein